MLQTDIKRYLKHAEIRVELFSEIDSTNAYAKRLVAEGALQGPLAVIAEQQTAGYGRQGRTFYSPKQVGLYQTLIWPIKKVEDAGLVTTGIATVSAEVLTQQLGVQVGIKWVNDLYYQQRKVAGILVEQVSYEGQPYLVIGMGLNINAGDYPADVRAKVGFLTEHPIDRNRLAAAIIDGFADYFTADQGRLMQRYRELSLVIGEEVDVALGSTIINGQVTGIDDHGGLIVQTGQEQRTFYSGEITKLHMKDWIVS